MSSTILTSFNKPATASSMKMTFDGMNLISADGNFFYIHDGVSEDILSSFPTPAGNQCALTFDGYHLISGDESSPDRIYVHGV